jgi:uncharacterized protein YfaS (alpha-2-macroglobulin family)
MRQLLFSGVLSLFAVAGAAQDYLPDRYMSFSNDIDFYGSDLDPRFETTLDACERACLADASCKAFTFNKRSNACFPKSEVASTAAYEGALSARVFEISDDLKRAAAARAGRLNFLFHRDLTAAKALSEGLGRRFYSNEWTPNRLIRSARDFVTAEDLERAQIYLGAALTLMDRPDLWLDYADVMVRLKPSSASQRRKNRTEALSATINAFLRTANPGMQVNALVQMADILQKSGRGRISIPALRLAQDIQFRDETEAQLEDAIGKYGFRIVDTVVESDIAEPRICATFSDPLVKTGVDYETFVQRPITGLTVEASGAQICISGVEHGSRHRIVFRQGLPASSGEVLNKDVALTLYVRDRLPNVQFSGRSYLLPKSADAALPITSVNATEVDLVLRRVSERNVLRSIQDNYFARPLSRWAEERFDQTLAEVIWEGKGTLSNELNKEVVTRLPLGEALKDQPPGIYMISAKVPNADRYDRQGATQWFVLSDLGISTMEGVDGMHVFVRALGDVSAKAGLEVTLVSRANAVLGVTTTDEDGYARFDPGLTRGTGAAAPGLLTVADGDQDFAFLPLTDPFFDLSDRGVAGREPAPPIDVFLTTDRGAYRAGETIYATALARGDEVEALDGVPLTAILTRPDGVEYARHFTSGGQAGGHVFRMPVGTTVPRGRWLIQIKADPEGETLASDTVLVEDFLPERIDFDVALRDGPLRLGERTDVTVDVRYLFGAPGADLPVEADMIVRRASALDGYDGYSFGAHDARFNTILRSLDITETTDANGKLTTEFGLPDDEGANKPLELEVVARIAEGSGRPVERSTTRLLQPAIPLIGIKPAFEFEVPEGTEAEFSVVGVGTDLSAEPMQLRWSVSRVTSRYQWFSIDGDWNWERIETKTRVAGGELDVTDGPARLAAPVEWGQYELRVERLDGAYTESSVRFYAGWYVPDDPSQTPDTLDLSLDRPDYAIGDTANLRIVPRYAGTAMISVMSNRLIHHEVVEVTEGENLIPLEVTQDWGAGAYVSASVIRPMDVSTGRNPARSLGIAHATIDPGDKQLTATFDVAAESLPRSPLQVALNIDGVAPGETAHVTIAAVDVGILNLTGFDSPNPSDHYFGQRRLGMGLRDIYGRLIDGLNGSMGTVRSGGDALTSNRSNTPPPPEDLVAFFSGPLTVGADGRIETSFDMPEFNGTVRLMAVAWTPTGVGQAEAEVLVRDPVVLTASLPRFLAPGDESRVLIELVHADGPTGDVTVEAAAKGVLIDTRSIPASLTLTEGGKQAFQIPLRAEAPGIHSIDLALTTPSGQRLTKTLTLGVFANDPVVSRQSRFTLAAGDSLTFDDNVFAGLRSGTGSAVLSVGPLARFDAPGLLASLDRYPYGCTEQVTSRAMPLLYFNEVAQALGLDGKDTIERRIAQSIDRILSRQSSNGAFGLWRPATGDLWLDAYVTDFLSRARAQGYEVSDRAFRMSLDNLRNQVNFAPDFDAGGQAIAYALMVLAREGAAAMGDLRYYVDVKGDAFTTPLGAAQLGTALASYGDPGRADEMFGRAVRMMARRLSDETTQVWRTDYGTNLRDAAAVLALSVEAGSEVVDREVLAQRVASFSGRRSTQEATWSLLAARALLQDGVMDGFTVDGRAVDGPFVRLLEADTTFAPIDINNGSNGDEVVTLTTFGVPSEPEPKSGNGYAIDRRYYTLEGDEVDPTNIKIGDRLVTVLEVEPLRNSEARLMVDDPLPAGFEIDNPSLLRSGDVRGLNWLKLDRGTHSEFRSDRFLTAIDWRSEEAFRLAYIVRAISPGTFHHPAASVEDMYRPEFRARTETDRIVITE